IDCGGPCAPCPPKKPKLSIRIEQPDYTYIGESFKVKALVSLLEGEVGNLEISISIEPELKITQSKIQNLGKISKSQTKEVDWEVRTTNLTKLGEYKITIMAMGEYVAESRVQTLRETYMSSTQSAISIQDKTIQNRVFNNVRSIYKIASTNTSLWFILLLLLLGLGYFYYSRRQRQTPIEAYIRGVPNNKRYSLEKPKKDVGKTREEISDDQKKELDDWKKKKELEAKNVQELREETKRLEEKFFKETKKLQKENEDSSNEKIEKEELNESIKSQESEIRSELEDVREIDRQLGESLEEMRRELEELSQKLGV
ncbi:MAG: hypothetical protein ABH950_08345, partial [Candidatus Altiarchaeota archaeon]